VLLFVLGCFAWHPSRGGGEIRPAGPRVVDPADVAVLPGYRLEVVATGLDLPTSVTFDDHGGVYVVEGGYSYGELFLVPRILRVDGGRRDEVARGDNGPWTGAIWQDGHFWVAEGGVERGGRIVRVDADGRRTAIVDGLPSLGDHHTDGPALGPDGWVYFGQGTATNSGVVGTDNHDFGWLDRHRDFHDVPCRDVTLTGQTFRSEDPKTGDEVVTGAYQAYGTAGATTVPGQAKCSGAVFKVRPDGSDLTLVAWGFRNPFGLAFDPKGQLWVTDNGYDDRGSRPVFGASDWLWRVEEGAWYGWPDHADGRRLGAARWKPPGHPRPEPLIANPPEGPRQPAAIFGVHSSADGLDFSRSERFGYVGQAFVALFGDQAGGVGKVESPVGFQVVRVDPAAGVVEPFVTNRGHATGPASWLGTRGLERPLAVRFDPSGESLYIVDFGVLMMDGAAAGPQAGTGVLWKLTRE
jgi:glucose/arabinose dehydrogenase